MEKISVGFFFLPIFRMTKARICPKAQMNLLITI